MVDPRQSAMDCYHCILTPLSYGVIRRRANGVVVQAQTGYANIRWLGDRGGRSSWSESALIKGGVRKSVCRPWHSFGNPGMALAGCDHTCWSKRERVAVWISAAFSPCNALPLASRQGLKANRLHSNIR